MTVAEDEDEETDVGNAINSLLNDLSDDTSSNQTQSHPAYPAYPSDATGYPDGYPGANTTSPNENYPSSTNTTSGTGGLSSELMESLNGVGLEMTELLPSPPTNVTETVIERRLSSPYRLHIRHRLRPRHRRKSIRGTKSIRVESTL